MIEGPRSGADAVKDQSRSAGDNRGFDPFNAARLIIPAPSPTITVFGAESFGIAQ